MYHTFAKDIGTPGDWPDHENDKAEESTEYDRYDMTRMGKKQELRRVFRQFSILSFTCVIMGTWEFLLTANTQGQHNPARVSVGNAISDILQVWWTAV